LLTEFKSKTREGGLGDFSLTRCPKLMTPTPTMKKTLTTQLIQKVEMVEK
jgi:hypothetical protein